MNKILIIEDDPLVSRMYQKVMDFAGFEISAATDGAQGLARAKEFKPDIILCDVMMPVMNGMEVLDNLKGDPLLKNIPVIMLTNLSGTQDADLAVKKGAHSYLVKSQYKPDEVVNKVKEVLSKNG